MLIYIRKITNSDTKKQIETTAEAYEFFFNGDPKNPKGVSVEIQNFNGKDKSLFKVSKAGGKANSYRFSSIEGKRSFAKFLVDNCGEFEVEDILKIEKKNNNYTVFLIKKDQKEYEYLSPLIKDKQNTVLFINTMEDEIKVNNLKIDKSHQRIFFGAPGTGKSYELNKQANKYFGKNYERVTFHPNFMYGNFVGAFKPFPKVLKKIDGNIKKDEDGNIQETIIYDYIPGILIKQLVKALRNPDENYLVLIEEINRANVAAVFGDFFQLLDRKSDGDSEYVISTSKELQEYFIKEFLEDNLDEVIKQKLGENFEHIYLPKNLFIWATMNSADQGVMPMDTAFRRRWDFEYLGIDSIVEENKLEFEKYKFKINSTEIVNWDNFRRELNKKLTALNIPEDKLIGPYFVSKATLEDTNLDKLTEIIKNKVLMYLYEDAAKAYKSSLFAEGKYSTYSTVCKYFDENALNLFKGNLNVPKEPINYSTLEEGLIDSEE